MGYSIMKKLHEVILRQPVPTEMIAALKREAPMVIMDSAYILSWGFKFKFAEGVNFVEESKSSPKVGAEPNPAKVSLGRIDW